MTTGDTPIVESFDLGICDLILTHYIIVSADAHFQHEYGPSGAVY